MTVNAQASSIAQRKILWVSAPAAPRAWVGGEGSEPSAARSVLIFM
jgi:hypothetical protein